MKKKIMVVLLSAGCLMVPACLTDGAFGFGVSNVGIDVCFPGSGLLNVCADVQTPVGLDDLFNGG